MNFSESIVLENSAVLLRPLEEVDMKHLKHFAIDEPETWKYSLTQIQSPENLESYIATAVQARKQNKEYPFIVYDKLKKAYAGSTRFYDIHLQNKTLSLGYTWYGKLFRGTTLNKNCKLLLLSYAFETLKMERVEFRADLRNEQSIYAMRSIGCVVEGILRSHLPTVERGRRDSIVLSILKHEWEASVKQNLIRKAHNL